MNLLSALPYINPIHTQQPVALILKRFLALHKIKVDITVIHERLIEHPYFPSILSVSDVLTGMNVSNQAFKVDLETLKKYLEDSVLIHLKSDGGIFCILEEVKDGHYKIITEKGESRLLAEDQFKEAWEGIILDVDLTDYSEQEDELRPNTSPIYLKYSLATSWAFITFYVLWNQFANFALDKWLMLALSVSGVLVSWLLVLQHLHKNNLLVQQLCQSETQKGCNSVLNSKTAQVTPWLSMADLGLIYFAGGILSIVFVNVPVLVYELALFSPIFSLYTIYLQAMIIRQWCRLCLIVHAFIFIAFIISGSVIWANGWDWPSTNEFGIFLLPGLIWFLIKPYIKQLKDAEQRRTQYAFLKSNPEVFSTLVRKQPKVDIPESLKVFTFGKKVAEHELTIVSNPFCSPCAEAHQVVNGWLKQDLQFKINIIFTHPFDKDAKRRLFVEHLNSVTNSEELGNILHAWFASTDRDVEKWSNQNNLKPLSLPYSEGDLQHWLELAGIHQTPSFFIDGHKLPPNYRLQDIRYLVSEA